jgi:hypothetical protein
MATTTVRQLFNKVDIPDFKQVKWGDNFHEPKQRVYVVSSSENPDKHLGVSAAPNFVESPQALIRTSTRIKNP